MKYCIHCVTPDTRPNVIVDATGVCSACKSHGHKNNVDWDQRADAFQRLADEVKQRKAEYDCVIPVSGGKDSTWQTVLCLEHGLHPLAVTWRPPARTSIGAQNLENLISLGVDHIDFRVNPLVEKRFTLHALAQKGDPAIPMHMALFNIPLRIAALYRIPLVVWGENSAVEYSGAHKELEGFRMTRAWLHTFGVTGGTTAEDWVNATLSRRDLPPYFGPDPDELDRQGTRAVFLGQYFKWDPEHTLQAAMQHGFQPCPEGPLTGYYNYADIDDAFLSVHHFLKWYKFGFTRTFDNLSLEIRNARISREDAIEYIRERGDETPHTDIEAFCRYTDITIEHFFTLIEPFRNKDIWVQEHGVWKIKDFLIPDWKWS